jgi:hypothetical protein
MQASLSSRQSRLPAAKDFLLHPRDKRGLRAVGLARAGVGRPGGAMMPTLPPRINLSRVDGRVTFSGAIVAPLRTTDTKTAACVVHHPHHWYRECEPNGLGMQPHQVEVVVHPNSHQADIVDIYL